MIAVFDIDGTLADISYRMQKAGDAPSKKNKKDFQAWLNKLQKKKDLLDDKPIKGMVDLASSLANSFTVVYITGRAEKYKDATLQWLWQHKFPPGELHMRPDDDMRDTGEYKEEQMLLVMKTYEDNNIIVFDDDPEENCHSMYKKHGWTHLKAMENIDD